MSDLQDLIHTNARLAYDQGVKHEQQRIIEIIENRICFDHANGCEHGACYALTDLMPLIKEEQK